MQLVLTYVMDTLAARVKAARKYRGLTQVQLADKTRASQSEISKIERGEIERSTNLISIATALGCDPVWLDIGDGMPPWVEGTLSEVTYRSKMTASPGNTGKSTVTYSERKYPLLSSVQAGSWGVTDIDPSAIKDEIICPIDLGANGFCLTVDGDSMTSSEGPYSFPSGMSVCFQAVEEAQNKDFVCVVREGENNAIFKQLLLVDGMYFLYSLNPHWPTKFIQLREGDRITGKLRYAGWQF